ncbi:hypothetical protein NW767_015054 [Fusarium falciforme]|nr:hypothetical protein NW767_015054 [Fusarium falciforme]
MAVENAPADAVFPKTDLWTFLFQRPDRMILTDAGTERSYTFSDLLRLTPHIGHLLQSRCGLNKGDVLSVVTSNSIDVPPVIWGALSVGVVVNPLNPAFTVNELAHYFKSAGAKAVVTQKESYAAVLEARRGTGLRPDHIIVLDDDDTSSVWLPSSSSLPEPAPHVSAIKNPEQELSFLVYSSGTTGLPKGVMLSHTNVVANLIQMASIDEGMFGPRDRALAFLPFFHIYGLTAIVNTGLYLGMNTFVMPRFELEAACRCVHVHKITYVYIVPPVALQFLQNPVVERYDLSSIRLLTSAAAPLSVELIHALKQRRGLIIRQLYGMSECSPCTHGQTFADAKKHPGSVGRPIAGVSVRFMPVDGEASSARREGELWVKGPNVFLGYYNNPQATEESLTSDGYYKTGDVGYEDPHGNLIITDRIKELIKYKGFQIAPAELEDILHGHPAVADCAVVGVPEGQVGSELPRAFVKPADSVQEGPKLAEELQAHVNGKVAHYKRLRGGVIFLETIPRNPSGKILRRELKKSFASKI